MPAKRFPIRECYCPAHFGNSYEVMWPRERVAYLEEMKWWGFNRFADWMTTTDSCSPYTGDFYNLAKEHLERKLAAFRAAQELGMGLNLILTANHVYLDQLRPKYDAKRGKGIFGQLICPSHPEARKVIRQNFERWFADFARAGVRLSVLTGFAYDFGGCACRKCSPWILTFAEVMREAHEIAEQYHPGIEPWVCSWWWTPEEHELFNQWAAAESPGWLKGMTMHIQYGETRFKDVEVPEGCQKVAFVHIGYGDNPAAHDIYTKWGAVIAPNRIPKTLDGIQEQGAAGFQAYSEGVFDDVNKAILAGLASGRASRSQTILKQYARRYLGGDANGWADWLEAWGDRLVVDIKAAEAGFKKLEIGAKPGWRLEHLRSKLRLEKLSRAIGLPEVGEWTPAQLKLADRFWAEQEHLQRDVYRLGPVRHVFHRKFHAPAWYDSWMKTMEQRTDQEELPAEA